MSTDTAPLAPYYTCHVCRRTFTLPAAGIIVGETKQQRLGKVAQTLVKHLQTEHKDQVMQLAILGQQFQGWLFVDQFDTNDADLIAEGEPVRKVLRKITKRVHISDEIIARQVKSNIGEEDEDIGSIVFTLLKTMRDRLEETQETKHELESKL